MQHRMRTATPGLLVALLFSGVLPAYGHRNAVEQVADTLPHGAVVMLVSAGAWINHPGCGRIEDDDWQDMQWELSDKLNGQLNDKRNRGKEVEYTFWHEPGGRLMPEERDEIMGEAHERGATHVLYLTSSKNYDFSPGRGFVLASIEWSFRLVETETRRAKLFHGRITDWAGVLLGPEALQAMCPG